MSKGTRNWLLALSVLGSSGAGSQEGARGQEKEESAVRAVVLEKPAGTRETYFRLDRSGAREAEPIGLVRWLSGPAPEIEGGWTVENEILFFAGGTRLYHSEHLAPTNRRLVWREVRPHSGRTVRLEWPGDGPPVSFESTGGTVLRKELAPGTQPLFPLALVEFLRSSGASGRYSVYQPLGNDFEELEASVLDHGSEREVELRRTNGDLAGRYRFQDGNWVEFQWQEGGTVARPVDRAEYDRLRTRAGASD